MIGVIKTSIENNVLILPCKFKYLFISSLSVSLYHDIQLKLVGNSKTHQFFFLQQCHLSEIYNHISIIISNLAKIFTDAIQSILNIHLWLKTFPWNLYPNSDRKMKTQKWITILKSIHKSFLDKLIVLFFFSVNFSGCVELSSLPCKFPITIKSII